MESVATDKEIAETLSVCSSGPRLDSEMMGEFVVNSKLVDEVESADRFSWTFGK
jgi:hypothetical protein